MSVRAYTNGALWWMETPVDLTIRRPHDGDFWITQQFGVVSITGNVHKGVDIAHSEIPIRSVADGRVRSTYTYGRDVPGLESDGSPGGYGNTVNVEHTTPSGFRYLAYHCHLKENSIVVRAGDVVVAGQVLGLMGTTGISSGVHEHFELRLDDAYPTRFDPLPFFNRVIIPPEEDWYMALTPAGKQAADRLFNDPAKVANLDYALAVADALEAAKSAATASQVGASLVTLGPDGRKATELDGRALAEIHKAKMIDPVTNEERWNEKVLDSLVLQRVREQRQWIAANPVVGSGTEPPAPGKPPKP